ncbi:unnamed protein product [Rhizoctonia solani]|uniref:Uncharacterized protein n=1 Tax=Rhizoctonia solani TaxID=456999 RepID=A0A8H3DTM7_9AGAM|nr:unnamed protein product [Rhizoctonia solani]
MYHFDYSDMCFVRCGANRPDDQAIQGHRQCEYSRYSLGLRGVSAYTRGIHTDSLLNYEPVKYFNGKAHQCARYREVISRYPESEIHVIAAMNVMSLLQNLFLSVDTVELTGDSTFHVTS